MIEIDKVKKSFDKVNEGMRELRSGPLEYYLGELCLVYEEFFKRCSPYKIGDRVQLICNIDCSDSPGWKSSEHFLIQGNTGTISEMNFSKDKTFRFGVVLDNQTYLRLGEKIPITEPSMFWLNETVLRKYAND